MKKAITNIINRLSGKYAAEKTFDSNAPAPDYFKPKTKRTAFLVSAVLFAFLSLFSASGEARAATYTVNMDTDAGDLNLGDGICDSNLGTSGEQCTLRAAVEEADYFPNPDLISFSLPLPSSITLTIAELTISSSMSIDGPGARSLTIERAGGQHFRIFRISGVNASVNISGVSVANGLADYFNNSAPFDREKGGAIYSSAGVLNLTAVTIRNNTAERDGGGVYISSGTTNITHSTINHNNSGTNSSGGGIYNQGTINISNSTISNNTVNSDSTLGGGGIYNSFGGTTNLTNVTVSYNAAKSGGGIENANSATVNLRNTIVAQNTATAAADVSGTFASQGNNLIGISAGNNGFINGANGDKVGTGAAPIDAQLGALQSNGGPTDTRALLSGSPAIDAGNNCVVNQSCPGLNPLQPLTTDQRGAGFPRQVDRDGDGTAIVDIGAFESPMMITTAAGVIVSGRVSTAAGKGIRNARVTITFPNGETRAALSSAFGYYRFDDIPAGETYVISVSGKRFSFADNTRIRNIAEDALDIDFIADAVVSKRS